MRTQGLLARTCR